MYNEKSIGVFDSGVGGITVLKELVNEMPQENYIYFGDTARVPYGEKTKEELIRFTREILNMFKNNDVKAAVMACNTSSAVALDVVADEYDFPVFGLISPVAHYISGLNCKNIGVMATNATVNSNAYENAIIAANSDKKVFQISCPGLVEIVETGAISSEQSYKKVESYVSVLLENNVEKIILGCTHYPYLAEIINKITENKVELIDPAVQIVKTVKGYFEANSILNITSQGSRRYIVSSNPDKFVTAAQSLFDDCRSAELLDKLAI